VGEGGVDFSTPPPNPLPKGGGNLRNSLSHRERVRERGRVGGKENARVRGAFAKFLHTFPLTQGEGYGEGSPIMLSLEAIFTSTYSTSHTTSEFLTRRTVNPRAFKNCSLCASRLSAPASKWASPSISMMSICSTHRKSTMNGPMGTWRRNFIAWKRWLRSFFQRIISPGVMSLRSFLAKVVLSRTPFA